MSLGSVSSSGGTCCLLPARLSVGQLLVFSLRGSQIFVRRHGKHFIQIKAKFCIEEDHCGGVKLLDY